MLIKIATDLLAELRELVSEMRALTTELRESRKTNA